MVLVIKNPYTNAGRHWRRQFDPWIGKIPWRSAWQPIAVFLPKEFHGQRSLAGCSPLHRTESDMTEGTWHACIHSIFGFLNSELESSMLKCVAGILLFFYFLVFYSFIFIALWYAIVNLYRKLFIHLLLMSSEVFLSGDIMNNLIHVSSRAQVKSSLSPEV